MPVTVPEGDKVREHEPQSPFTIPALSQEQQEQVIKTGTAVGVGAILLKTLEGLLNLGTRCVFPIIIVDPSTYGPTMGPNGEMMIET